MIARAESIGLPAPGKSEAGSRSDTGSILSGDELAALGKVLAEATDPHRIVPLRNQIEDGFYGIKERKV